MNDIFKPPYKTGKELLNLKDDLLKSKKRIIEMFPTLEQDVEKYAAYTKYSKNNGLGLLVPSKILDYGRQSVLIDKLPKKAELYREYVYNKDGDVLRTCILADRRMDTMYIVNFDGYRYLFDNPSKVTDEDTICRLRFEDDKLVSYEECYNRGKEYYSEFYYSVGDRNYCVTEFLFNNFLDEDAALLDELETHSLTDFISTMDEEKRKYAEKAIEESIQLFSRLAQSMRKEKEEFVENIHLPVTDKHSPVNLNFYELFYDNQENVAQIDEINLFKGSKKTIYPKQAKNTKFFKTKQSLKKLEERLRKAGYDCENKIKFAAFWKVFKEFALYDKFNCADDSILWELGCNSVHIARQFIHEDGDGQYEKMEQLNIDFDVGIDFDIGNNKAMWSGDDLQEYFEEIEQSAPFKSILPESVIKLSMFFDEV